MNRQARTAREIEAFIIDEGHFDEPGGNVIHSAAGAAEFGFGGALVPGATIYSWSVPVIMDALGEEWADSGWAEFRFRRPTYPGDRLTVAVEREDDGRHTLVVSGPDGEPRLVGRVGLGEAPWSGDLARSERRVAEPRVEQGRVPLTTANAPVGQDLRALSIDVSEESARSMSRERLATDHPLFTGERPRIHPGAHTNLTGLLKHTYDFAPSIHTATLVPHRRPAYAGQVLTVAGRCVETFHRGTDDYVVVDGSILGADGEELKHIRHTVIFSVAKRTPSAAGSNAANA